MTTDFAERLAKVPPTILEAARATNWPNAPLSDVLNTAEMMMRHLAGEKPSEDRHLWQPFLTARQTRLILQALEEFETVIDDDVEPLRSLREWFKGTLHG